MVDLPERRKYVHITKPWLHTSHTLVLPAQREPPGREFTGRIALTKLPIHARLVREEFPNAQLVRLGQAGEIVKEICRGTVFAGFLDDRAALSALREMPAECSPMGLRVHPLSRLTFPLGVGSTFEAAGAADPIRDNIGGLFRDGTLAVKMAKYSYFGIDAAWATYALMAAEEHARFVAWGIGGLGIALAITVWQAASLRQRKRSEAALRESEERFRFAQKAASIGTFNWNIETGASAWTPELEVMYGLPPAGFLGTQKAWENLIHPDDRARVLQRTRESLETGTPAEEEWRVIWPDGSVHWIAGRWQAFKNSAGEPRHVAGINIDVTDRKNMEEALRKSEERFRLATKATNDAIWDIDLKAGTVSWNDTYSVLYGRPETADSWQFWIDRIHPEDRARTVDEFQAAIGRGAASWSAEYRFRRADGGWAYIYDRAYIARDANGNAWRIIGAMQDLTEQKKAEAALRESEERFRRVFEEGPLGLALVGKDYRFVQANGALCQLLGYDEAQLLQMSFIDITHPDDVRMDVELAERLFKREIPFYRLQKRYVKKNGEIIWINLTASMIHGPDGEPLHGLAMIEDVTEIKRTQDEALARQKLESMGLLASGIAHDFNNLLGGILTSAELALTERAESAPWEEELLRIKAAALGGAQIVRELMIFGTTENPAFEPVDCSLIVREMIQVLKVSISKAVIIKSDLAEDLGMVHGNAAQIRQLIMNLVLNASQALGDREGEIRITTKMLRQDLSTPSAVEANLPNCQYLTLEVADTGSGMTEEVKAKIFDPFFSTKPTGRGLGLAVVQRIVRAHGGVIKVVSTRGSGTTFQVILPCAPKCETVEDRSRNSHRVADESFAETVLIIEDEPALRTSVSKILRMRGFSVIEAEDGNAGVDLFVKNAAQIDVVLLDMTLPGRSGREVLHELQRIAADVKIIVTSAYGQQHVQSSLGGLQTWGYIQKPYRVADLEKTLQKCAAKTRTLGHTAV
jgi:PAS domain S-box-containing protein